MHIGAYRLSKGGNLKMNEYNVSLEGNPLPFFVDEGERALSILGSGYLKNLLLNGNISKTICVVSNKRLYFKGDSYFSLGSGFKRARQEYIVDLKDVTATGTRYISNTKALLTIPIFLLLTFALFSGLIPYELMSLLISIWTILIPVIIFSIVYFLLTKKNLFMISFAGGQIAFNTAWYSKMEMEAFQKILHITKENQ